MTIFVIDMAGGYDYRFVSPPDDLLCLICHLVSRDAHQVECCGKVFCKTCITTVNDRLGSCPNCRHSPLSIFKDGRSRRSIKQLKLSCRNEDKGCEWSGALESYTQHECECRFQLVACSNWNCSEEFQWRFLEEHLKNECPERKVKCEVCQKKVTYQQMQSHDDVCPKVEVECTNSGCTVKIYRDQLSAHRNVCPKQKISCPYRLSGCVVAILREDRDKHLQENIESHSAVADMTIKHLQDKLDDAEHKLSDMKMALESRCVTPVTFKMSGYSQKKANQQTWKSPHFYTHSGGYRMQLLVEPTSLTDDCSDHLSVYIEVGSNNSDELVWPFCGSLIIQILNQDRDSGHYSHTLTCCDEDAITMNDGVCGYCGFITHTKLEKSVNSYLKNDTVYFRIKSAHVSSQCKPWLTCSPCAEI